VGFQNDLVELSKNGPADVGRVVAMLSEIDGDERREETLTLDDASSDDGGFSICSLSEFTRRRGLNLRRLRLLDVTFSDTLLRQRFIYGVDSRPQRRLWFLAIMPRTENYERHHPRIQRVEQEYDYHGLPKLPRG